jgi:hypothetical protein
MGYATVGLFFLRFYLRTGDRLFAMFAAAFGVFACVRLTMMLLEEPSEHQVVYWVRFIGYVLILVAIVDKNLPRANRAVGGAKNAASSTNS